MDESLLKFDELVIPYEDTRLVLYRTDRKKDNCQTIK